MKRRVIGIVVFALASVLLCAFLLGCSKTTKNRSSMFMTAAYSFVGPYEGLNVVQREINVNETEKDQYGRELFMIRIPSDYEFYDTFSEKTRVVYDVNGNKRMAGFRPSEAIVIIQKYDNQHIYYYEDNCFLLETKDGFSLESVEELKQRNDWDKPLQLDECSIRLNGEMYEGMTAILWDHYSRSAISNLFSGRECLLYSVVEDADGRQLFGVCVKGERPDEDRSYFVIYDPSLQGIDPEKGVMELTSLDFSEELHELKLRNNWNFTDCPGE